MESLFTFVLFRSGDIYDGIGARPRRSSSMLGVNTTIRHKEKKLYLEDKQEIEKVFSYIDAFGVYEFLGEGGYGMVYKVTTGASLPRYWNSFKK